MADERRKCRYFIAKCANIGSLQTCIKNKQWACKDRVTSPEQPRVILSSAFDDSVKVIIIFSVNNCHGWHGYTEMETKPCLRSEGSTEKIRGECSTCTLGSCEFMSHDCDNNRTCKCTCNQQCVALETNSSGDSKSELSFVTSHENAGQRNHSKDNIHNDDPWYYFNVKWITEFHSKFGEKCLPFQKTVDLCCIDKTPLNKARNWNELDEASGQTICQLIDEHYKKLESKHQEKIKMQESKLPPPFVKNEAVHDVSNFVDNWDLLLKRVESELGTVILACPFGSQRYNLDTVHSDMDMFIVYQTRTKNLLNFDPKPQQTVKSSERESLDYTIHELHRFGELLLAGDHRCVETLFLHSSSYVKSSHAFQQLIEKRHFFLNSLCLDKYLRDALGGKGLKLFQKWTKDKPSDEQMTERESKLAYIIIRLLQNAKNVVDGVSLSVYREDDSEEKKLLMALKTKDCFPFVEFALKEITRLTDYIDKNKSNVSAQSDDVKDFMDNWILNLRKDDLFSK